MLIGVISDTHRSMRAIQKVVKVVKDADVLIHLGDNVDDVKEISKHYKGEIINVRGNCDFSYNVPSERIVEIGGVKMFITHGHHYNVKYSIDDLLAKASEVGAKIALYGHTHVSAIRYEEGIFIINPGSPALPRDGYESIATIEIQEDNVTPSIVCL